MANLMKRYFHVKKKRIGEFSGSLLAFDMENSARYTFTLTLAFKIKWLRANLIEMETAKDRWKRRCLNR